MKVLFLKLTTGLALQKKKKFSINFTNGITKFCDNSHLFFKGKKIYKFEDYSKNVDYPAQFNLESISKKFDKSFKGNVYEFHLITMLLINLTY